MTSQHINPSIVRYIKLGQGGGWEEESLRDGIIRFGTGSHDPGRFEAALADDWERVTTIPWARPRVGGALTRAVNETRAFFTADRDTLWITFAFQSLWWGFATEAPPERHPDGHGTFRRIKGGWRNTDHSGDELRMERLAGSLTKSALYRGTSFRLSHAASTYVVDRINGTRSPSVTRAKTVMIDLEDSVIDLVKLLEPRDFELLVDLVYSSSGWRRITDLGKTQKTIDLVLELPSTGERAWVQVKSASHRTELAEYMEKVEAMPYERLFYVYHSGDVGESSDKRIVVVGPRQLAHLVIEAGLTTWLIDRVS